MDKYIQAATRDNTRKSYQYAIRHFEVEWGGMLPTTAKSITQYLSDHAESHSVSTLRQRIAALSRWHIDQGFADPTKASIVKKVMKGIGEVHGQAPKQARPLQLSQLEMVIEHLEGLQRVALEQEEWPLLLRATRNKSLILMGFWRAFRSDELCRINAGNVSYVSGQGMEIYLSRSKTLKDGRGCSFKVPALNKLCPVTAYQDWIRNSGISTGPAYRGIHKSGKLSENALNPDSVPKILREVISHAGIEGSESFSSHSLRRGFATWAAQGQWSLNDLMTYVGWKDPKSAMRYIEGAQHTRKIQQLLAHAGD